MKLESFFIEHPLLDAYAESCIIIICEKTWSEAKGQGSEERMSDLSPETKHNGKPSQSQSEENARIKLPRTTSSNNRFFYIIDNG